MQLVFGLIPFTTALLWSVYFYLSSGERTRSWRWSLAKSCIVLAAYILFLTEICSAFHLLQYWPIFTFWIVATLLPLCLLWHCRESIHPTDEIQRLRKKLEAIPYWTRLLLGIAFGLILVMAVVTPPMNFDVQIYHLPRQIYWMMYGSVEPFIASHSHQISMPVLGEFLGLNLLILSGGDSLHNLVQTLFLLASCGIVTLIVRSVGGSPRAQALSLIFVVFVPVLFLEASNAKNDIILSFFILIPLLVGVNIWTGRWSASVPLLMIASLSAGLAFATKGTAIAYLIAPALLIIAACIHRKALHVLLLAILPGIFLVTAPAAPQFLRNIEMFGSPAGPNLHHTNLCHDPLSVLSVAVRNSVGQFTWDSERWNLKLEKQTRKLLSHLGVNPDDPATTFEGQNFHLPYYAGLEDIVPAPFQTAFIILLPLSLLIPSFRRSQGVVPLFMTAYFSIFLFCFIFRWQPWQGRLLIPAYFMAAPLAGMVLDLLRPRWLPGVVILMELLALKPHLMYAGQRPLLGEASIFRMSKSDQMSRMMPGRAEDIQKLMAHLKEHPEIHKIMIDGGSTEIYGLLREIRIVRPDITILSGHFDQPSRVDAVISTTTPFAGVPPPPINPSPTSPPGFQLEWNGVYYRAFTPTPAGDSSSVSDKR
jgi:hypothetical protein